MILHCRLWMRPNTNGTNLGQLACPVRSRSIANLDEVDQCGRWTKMSACPRCMSQTTGDQAIIYLLVRRLSGRPAYQTPTFEVRPLKTHGEHGQNTDSHRAVSPLRFPNLVVWPTPPTRPVIIVEVPFRRCQVHQSTAQGRGRNYLPACALSPLLVQQYHLPIAKVRPLDPWKRITTILAGRRLVHHLVYPVTRTVEYPIDQVPIACSGPKDQETGFHLLRPWIENG